MRVNVNLDEFDIRLLQTAVAYATDAGKIGWNDGVAMVSRLMSLRMEMMRKEPEVIRAVPRRVTA